MGRTRGGQDLTEGRARSWPGAWYVFPMDWIIFVKWGKARYNLGRLVYNIGRRLGVDRLCKCAYIFLQLRKTTMHNLDGKAAKWETIRTTAISTYFSSNMEKQFVNAYFWRETMWE